VKHKQEAEMVVAEALKKARAMIRLKHSLAADRECNEVLPALEAAIVKRLAAGKPYRPDVKALLEE
jgi:hypothetical protein